MFLSVDPLATDFVAWSPYNYVMGNPIRFVDPDGRDVHILYQGAKRDRKGRVKVHRFGKNKGLVKTEMKKITYSVGQEYSGSNEFVKDVFTSLNHISSKNADGGIIADLANGDFDVEIRQTDNGSLASPDGKTVSWDNKSVSKFLDRDKNLTGQSASPALMVLHELGHSFRVKHKKSLVLGLTPRDLSFFAKQREEENIVVNSIEKPAAVILGDGIRSEYGDANLETKTDDPLSNN